MHGCDYLSAYNQIAAILIFGTIELLILIGQKVLINFSITAALIVLPAVIQLTGLY